MVLNQRQKHWVQQRARELRRLHGVNEPTSNRAAEGEIRTALKAGSDPSIKSEQEAPAEPSSSVSIPVPVEAGGEEPPAHLETAPPSEPAADPEKSAPAPEPSAPPPAAKEPEVIDGLEAMSHKELKKVCEERGIVPGSTRGETLARIQDDLAGNLAPEHRA
jgi:hypothetical protein